MGSQWEESDRRGGAQGPPPSSALIPVGRDGKKKSSEVAHRPERKPWKYAEVAKDFHRAHGFAPYVMDFKGALQASAEDDTLSRNARRIMDGLKLLEWGNLNDAPVDAMPVVEGTDPQPRELKQAEIAARMGISASAFSEGCSELRSKGYLPENSTSLNLSDRRPNRVTGQVPHRNFG